MKETFKHVSIFLMFIVAVLLWNAVRFPLEDHFNFDYGRMILLLLWATCVVIIFHLLFYYFGKWPEKVAYICSGFSLVIAGLLLHFDLIPMAM